MKMDEKMKEALNEGAQQAEVSDVLWHKIRMSIYEKEQSEVISNTRFKVGKKKRLVTAVALCMLIGSITVIGATLSKGWSGHSYLKYRSLPTVERIQKDVGFVPDYVSELPGGFVFERGWVGKNSLMDESGNTTVTADEISFSYKRKNEEAPLFFGATKLDPKYVSNEERKLIASEKGIDFYYYEKMYKFVPPTYELTEEDKKARENGELEMSIGAPEISVELVQHLSWYKDGVHYIIGGNDCNFTQEALLEMAIAIINE